MDVFQAAKIISKGLPLLTEVRRAAKGDVDALQYVTKDGIYEGIDILRPGAGGAVRELVQTGMQTYRQIRYGEDPNVIDGEFRVLEDGPPWSGFFKRLTALPFGGHIFLGEPGSGKTTSAKRLAEVLAERHGYKVECVNMYGDDRPPGAVSISTDTLVKRMANLGAYLNAQTVEDDEEYEGEDEEDAALMDWDGLLQDIQKKGRRPKAPAVVAQPKLPPQRRVIILDEAGMGLTSSVHDPVRRSALQALAQCRHIDWVVIYIGQAAGQIPAMLLGQCAVWVKKPRGDEAETDRPIPIVRKLWRDAEEGFASLRHNPYAQGPYKNHKAWSYVSCKSLNGQPGYIGMVPFNLPSHMSKE